MALSPSQFYAGSVPPATWFTAVAGAVNGTYSFKSITIDGTGALSVTASPAGTLRLSATAGFGTSTPTSAVTKWDMYKYMVPFAMAHVANNGAAASLNWGFNVSSVSRTSPGVCTVTMSNALTNTSKCVALASPNSSTFRTMSSVEVTTTTVITVETYRDPDGLGVDSADFPFFVVVWGE